MKLDSYGIYFLSQAVMRKMPISYLIASFRNSSYGWDKEQVTRLEWIKDNYPDYYRTVMSGDIIGSILFLASSDISNQAIKEGHRSSVWINGFRAGSAEYIQGREYNKVVVGIFRDMKWAEKIFLSENPQFKENFGKLTWVNRY